MSPNVGNFVHDLVEMAKAMETLPQVQDDLTRTQGVMIEQARTIQSREEAIIRYKAEIEALNSRIRSLEVERDDASFRVMEMEDKTHQVMGMLIDFECKAKGARMILDPPKPEPELQPQAVPTATDQSVADPTIVAVAQDTENSSAFTTANQSENASTSMLTEEAPKSDANPTPASASGDQTQVSASTTAGHTDNVTSGSSQGPYFNKRYHDMPSYISYIDWIDGGGTEVDYFWRPQSRADVF